MSNESTDIVPGELYGLNPLYALLTDSLAYHEERYNSRALHMCVSPADPVTNVVRLLRSDGLGFIEAHKEWLTKEADLVSARLDASCEYVIDSKSLTLTPGAEQRKEQLMKLVIDHYSAPGRHYHNLSHIHHCLDMFFELLTHKELSKWGRAEKTSMLLAILFHDIVYNPLSSTNEEESAKFLENTEMYLGLGRWNTSTRFILATKNHHEQFADYVKSGVGSTCTVAMGFFLDIDLSILGASEEKYVEYAINTRKEYSMYSDQRWINGRLRFLTKLLAQNSIYISSYFLETYNAQAQANIAREIESLTRGIVFGLEASSG